jgi:hypothetical protein
VGRNEGRHSFCAQLLSKNISSGGEEGIRTPGSLSASTVFKTAALNHSATSP